MNNYERMTMMTEKELADFLSDIINCSYCPAREQCINNFCRDAIELWLQAESEG